MLAADRGITLCAAGYEDSTGRIDAGAPRVDSDRGWRHSGAVGVGRSPPGSVDATSGDDANGNCLGANGAGFHSIASRSVARQPPLPEEPSLVERSVATQEPDRGKNEEVLCTSMSELISGSMIAKMDELSLRLQDLQRGQDDMIAWVKKMCHHVMDVQSDVLGPSNASANPKNATALLEHAGCGPEKSDSRVSLEKSSICGDDADRTDTKILAMGETVVSEGVCQDYCGSALRPGLINLGEQLGSLEFPMMSCSQKNLGVTTQCTNAHLDIAQSLHLRVLSFRMTRCLPSLCKLKAIHPDSEVRMGLDVVSMLVLLFDSVCVPYQLSFEPDTSFGFWFVANWVTLVFWTLDIFTGFIAGYYDGGGPVLKLRKIALHYIRTFFFIDLMTVVSDWISMLVSALLSSSSASNVTLLKLLRILKLNRLLRLLGALQSGKFGQMYDRIINWSRQLGLDHQLQFCFNILQLMFAILWLNHMGCCLWNGVQSRAVQNWESASNIVDWNQSTDSDDWVYLLGFYWSMTAMVSGASIMSPTNVPELVFTILYVFFGLLVGSTLISSLAAMLLDLQMSNKEQRDSVRLLRKYMFQQGLEVGLALDVEKEVVGRMSKEKRLGAAEVPCLGLLSPAMRSALRYAIYRKPLKEHPFLGVCHVLEPSGLFTKKICEDVIVHETQPPGFQVFPIPDLGNSCEGPFYVVLGELEYMLNDEEDVARSKITDNVSRRGSASSPSTRAAQIGPQSTIVSAGQWLCELANWLQWSHRGSLNACVPCEYLRLRADVLLRIFLLFEELRWLAWQYATALCKAVDAEELDQLTDLPLRENLHESVVLSMKPEGRRQMSTGPLKLLQAAAKNKQTGWLPFSRTPYGTLLEQVDQGKCDLVMQGGHVTRIVSLVTLRLEREIEKDGRKVRQILAQICKSTRAKDAKCQLPGGKVRAGELPSQALARILEEQLFALTQVGLTTDRLQKEDNVVELSEEARPGASDLAVSSLGDLQVGSIVQLSGDRQSETKVVAWLELASKRIRIDTPLEFGYAIGTRVAKAGDNKKKVATTFGDSFDVDHKYIRTVYCGSLEAEDQVGKTLWRDSLEPGDIFDPTAGYTALLLLPGETVDGAPCSYESAKTLAPSKSALERDPGILCAWMDEADYDWLSTKKEGVELMRKWVAALKASIQNAIEKDSSKRSLELDPVEPQTLPDPSSEVQDGGFRGDGPQDVTHENDEPSVRPQRTTAESRRMPRRGRGLDCSTKFDEV